MSILSESKSERIQAIPSPAGGIGFVIAAPIIAAADIVVVIISGVLGAGIYHYLTTKAIGNVDTFAGIGLVSGVIYVISAYHMRLYRIQVLFRAGADYQQALTSWAFAILALTVVLFALKIGATISRGSVVCFVAIGGFFLVAWRRFVKRQLRKALETGMIRGRRAVVLGDSDELAPFSKRDFLAQFGFEEIERLSLPRDSSDHHFSLTLSAIRIAIKRARDSSAEEIVLGCSWSEVAKLELIRNELRLLPLPVWLLPDRAVSAVLAHEQGGPEKSFLVEIQRAPLTVVERLSKRILDVLVAGAGIIMTAPLMAVCAIAIKLDSDGPVIFRQRRKGFNSQEFVIYKFRTMSVLEDGPAIMQAKKGDRRVTGIGRFLRQASIDELPQLFNVIKGDMSVVGPRPHAISHDDLYGQLIGNYAFRHHVKPGITGWAQVHGYRGETPRLEQMSKRIELDLWYINNWNVWLDLKVILRTCFELLRRRNAY